MVEQVLDCRGEVREIALNFDIVLVAAVGAEEVVVVLNPLEFVGYDDRTAKLAVFQRARVRTTCKSLLAGVWYCSLLGAAVPSACAMNM